jgi:GTP-binding protein Era
MHPAAEDPAAQPYRCGYVAIAGRPNVGKSTLLNGLVGEKLSITSRKAQTTRHRVTGIRTTPTAQSIFVDTPGIQRRHASRLNARMNRTAREALAGVDAIVIVLEAGRTTAADREVLSLVPAGAPAVAALNKVDRLRERDALLPQMRELAAAFPFAAIVPVSAENGRGLDALAREVEALLPERAAVHGAEEITDRDERFLAAELIREKVFRLLGEEVPYATTVAIDRFAEEQGLRRIYATVYVDRDNQKAIVIGRGGAQMKEIATRARIDMERLFGGPVFLDVRVRVKRGWADDEAALTRLGY